ncbi:hypothetical protein U1Q18_027149 [Sarracenia purpurea var. burkii]
MSKQHCSRPPSMACTPAAPPRRLIQGDFGTSRHLVLTTRPIHAVSATLVKPSISKMAFKVLTSVLLSSASKITTTRSMIPGMLRRGGRRRSIGTTMRTQSFTRYTRSLGSDGSRMLKT